MSQLIEQLNAALADRVASAWRSLVQISSGRGSGAGTIWHADGLIITNAHVVRGDAVPQITLPDGRSLPAQILAVDAERDLAALVVDAYNLPTIEVGDSRKLRPGQWVTAVGHPWGVQGAITSGVVIGAGAKLPEMSDLQPGREWIALSLHMRPGHSGGPLVDALGRLVGINTMITGPDVGFAIPIQVVKAFLKERMGSQ